VHAIQINPMVFHSVYFNHVFIYIPSSNHFCFGGSNYVAGSQGEPLEFAQRLNIAIDIVHAIAYLHGYTGTHTL
jgi:hypothetical protein